MKFFPISVIVWKLQGCQSRTRRKFSHPFFEDIGNTTWVACNICGVTHPGRWGFSARCAHWNDPSVGSGPWAASPLPIGNFSAGSAGNSPYKSRCNARQSFLFSIIAGPQLQPPCPCSSSVMFWHHHLSQRHPERIVRSHYGLIQGSKA